MLVYRIAAAGLERPNFLYIASSTFEEQSSATSDTIMIRLSLIQDHKRWRYNFVQSIHPCSDHHAGAVPRGRTICNTLSSKNWNEWVGVGVVDLAYSPIVSAALIRLLLGINFMAS